MQILTLQVQITWLALDASIQLALCVAPIAVALRHHLFAVVNCLAYRWALQAKLFQEAHRLW